MMKKILMTVAVLGCAASIVSAQTVSSANVVGYSKVETTDEVLSMGGSQFVTTDANSLSAVLGDSMPIGSKAYVWGGAGYSIPEYKWMISYVGFPVPVAVTNGLDWTLDGETIAVLDLPAGSGFWLVAPVGAVGSNEALISGEVILADSVTNSIPPGLSIIASPYPAEVAVTNMGFSASIGDKVHLWTGSGYASPEYKWMISYVGFPVPVAVTNGLDWTLDGETAVGNVVTVGEGVWYESSQVGNVEWVQDRPFPID